MKSDLCLSFSGLSGWVTVAAALQLFVLACIPTESGAPAAPVPVHSKPLIESGLTPATRIVLLQIDCMRADHMSTYGYERSTTPVIDSIAAEGVRFSRAYAQANWTKPSVASLMTGRYVRNHGVTIDTVTVRPNNSPPEAPPGFESYPLPADLPVLAESFQNAGFQTAGFVENVHLVEAQGFSQGFDSYLYGFPASLGLYKWFRDEFDPARPTFTFAHPIGPHDPYDSSLRKDVDFSVYRSRFPEFSSDVDFTGLDYKRRQDLTEDDIQEAIAHYDAELALYDAEQVGQVLQALRGHEIYDDSLIVVIADHGEELYDHGSWAHGHSLYEEVNRVPMIIKPPRHMAESFPPAGSEIDEVVELVDLFPTLLDLADIPLPSGLDGQSLAPLLLGLRGVDADSFAITEYGHDILPGYIVAASVVRGNRKATFRYDTPRVRRLHGLSEDEEARFFEVQGFAEEEVERSQAIWAEELRQLIDDTLGASGVIEDWLHQDGVALTPDEVEALRELGYVE